VSPSYSPPAISFCIPCFNAARTIERCLKSVLAEAQTIPDCEIVLIDNASTDATVEIAGRLLSGLANARIIVNDRNIGRIENWNRCLELAKGRWLRFGMTNNVLLAGSSRALLDATEIGVSFVYSDVRRVEEIPIPLPICITSDPPKKFISTAMLGHFAQQGNITETLDGILFNGDFVRQESILFTPMLPYYADFLFVIDCAWFSYGGCKKIHSVTTLMDMGQPRFAKSGLDAEKYYFEARQCALRLADCIQSQRTAFQFLRYHYTHDYGGHPLSFAKTSQLFEGSEQFPPYGHLLRWRVMQTKLEIKHFTLRVMCKLGLWKAPEAKAPAPLRR